MTTQEDTCFTVVVWDADAFDSKVAYLENKEPTRENVWTAAVRACIHNDTDDMTLEEIEEEYDTLGISICAVFPGRLTELEVL